LKNPSQIERRLPYAITQCYLLPDRGERAPFNPSQTGRCTRFTYPEGMEGWVDLSGWLHT